MRRVEGVRPAYAEYGITTHKNGVKGMTMTALVRLRVRPPDGAAASGVLSIVASRTGSWRHQLVA